mmetsp:Transcript_52088/g.100725  ORF Transcript_52088/g.100725 Transcript_52088/m.100725 type:complete len:102 (+) Transcript_52088:380-685(+)
MAAWCIYTQVGMGLPPHQAWAQLRREQEEIGLLGAIRYLKPLSSGQGITFHVQAFAGICPEADTCRLQCASEGEVPLFGRCQHYFLPVDAGIYLRRTKDGS